MTKIKTTKKNRKVPFVALMRISVDLIHTVTYDEPRNHALVLPWFDFSSLRSTQVTILDIVTLQKKPT